MLKKRIVVLANSVKHDPGRCVAGRELPEVGGSEMAYGWNRPVSQVGEGELLPCHLRVEGGGELEVLDITEVPVTSRCSDPTQPENWYVDATRVWRKVGKWPPQRLGELAEAPLALWLQPGLSKTDRVSVSYLQQNPPAQSLYFIKVANAQLVRSEPNRVRLHFRYRGVDYNLSTTDSKARSQIPNGVGAVELGEKFVCVSLAPPFKGYHYKLVATII